MDDVLSLIGLINSAHKLIFGEECLNHLSNINFMFISNDASDKTKERYLKKCYFYKIQDCQKYDSKQLSKAIGKNNVKIIGVVDKGFATTIIKKLKEG